jgi:hypothetical protein
MKKETRLACNSSVRRTRWPSMARMRMLASSTSALFGTRLFPRRVRRISLYSWIRFVLGRAPSGDHGIGLLSACARRFNFRPADPLLGGMKKFSHAEVYAISQRAPSGLGKEAFNGSCWNPQSNAIHLLWQAAARWLLLCWPRCMVLQWPGTLGSVTPVTMSP